MNEFTVVNQILKDSVISAENNIVNEEIKVKALSFIKLRDILYVTGQIITENASEQVYIATIKSGFLKLSSVILAVQLQEDCVRIAAYSRGLINRKKVSKGAIDELRSRIKQYT